MSIPLHKIYLQTVLMTIFSIGKIGHAKNNNLTFLVRTFVYDIIPYKKETIYLVFIHMRHPCVKMPVQN
jgi:hypothetical protein